MEPIGFMTMFEFFIAIYLLYAAFKGDGKLYENEYINCSREEYIKGMRKLAALTGVVMLASCGLELFKVIEPASTIGWILWALTFGCILVMVVYSVKKTDRAAANAGRPTAYSKPDKPHDPLRAAFVFDDEDEEAEKAQEE
ncbi:MAG: hypothetical protein IKU32_05640 [Clostridia bacterium]|nr:hypothetical protein [Clostridia bacterium]